MVSFQVSPGDNTKSVDFILNILNRFVNRPGFLVGFGVAVGSAGVAVGPTGVAVGPTGVAVGPTGVAVGPTGVAVGPTGVAVGPPGVAVGSTGVAVGPTGVAVGSTGGAVGSTGGAVGSVTATSLDIKLSVKFTSDANTDVIVVEIITTVNIKEMILRVSWWFINFLLDSIVYSVFINKCI